MVTFVLVAASVYEKRLITRSVTKKEITNYQLPQIPMYQFDSLKNEKNRNLFAKADFFEENFCLVHVSSCQFH